MFNFSEKEMNTFFSRQRIERGLGIANLIELSLVRHENIPLLPPTFNRQSGVVKWDDITAQGEEDSVTKKQCLK